MTPTLPRRALIAALGIALSPAALAQISFTSVTNVPVGSEPDAAEPFDLDGDGDLDLAVTVDNNDRVVVLTNDGSGGFTLGPSLSLGSSVSPADLAAADFDGDGDTDLAVSLQDANQVRLVLNQGGVLALGSSATTGVEPRSIAAGDVNGDGTIDIVASNRESNSVTVVLNAGGALSTLGSFPAGQEPRGVALADLDGDGDLDVVVGAHDSRDVRVLLNNGGGSLTAGPVLSVGSQLRPEGVTTGDFDGDGDQDIAAATEGNGINFASVWLNTGAGAFGGLSNFQIANGEPSDVVAADLDLDGDLDLALAGQDTNGVSTLAGNGAGGFSASGTFATGASPERIAAADLNGDGSADLVTPNQDANSVTIALNDAVGNPGVTTYCIGAPNSVGAGASIGSQGSLSVAANSFTLTADGCPRGAPGLFYYGTMKVQEVFGNGFRCVGGQTFRLGPATPVSVAGTATRPVDFTALPASSGPGAILPGSTWNFQFWYRNNAGGGAGFNLSNGLSATFQP